MLITLFKHCNAVLRWKSSFQIVSCNITFTEIRRNWIKSRNPFFRRSICCNIYRTSWNKILYCIFFKTFAYFFFLLCFVLFFFFDFGIREDGITLLLKVFLSDILQIGSNYIHHPVLNCSDKSFFLEYREVPNFSTSDKGTKRGGWLWFILAYLFYFIYLTWDFNISH